MRLIQLIRNFIVLVFLFLLILGCINHNYSLNINNESRLLYEDIISNSYRGNNFECKIIDAIKFEKENANGQIYNGKSAQIQYVFAIAVNSPLVKLINSVEIEFNDKKMNIYYGFNNPQNLGNLKVWNQLTKDINYNINDLENNNAYLYMIGINSYPEDFLKLNEYSISDFLNAASSIKIRITYNYVFQEIIELNEISISNYDYENVTHNTIANEVINSNWGINLFTFLSNDDFKKYIPNY